MATNPSDIQWDNSSSPQAAAPATPAPSTDDIQWDAPQNNQPAKKVAGGYTEEAGFSYQHAPQANSLPPELEKKLLDILANDPVESAASHARQVADEHGIMPYAASDPKYADSFDEAMAYRKKYGSISDSIINHLPKPDSGQYNITGDAADTARAAVRGVASILPVNTVDAALHTAADVATGHAPDGVKADFNRWSDIDYGTQVGDEENHPVARITGQLLGGLLIPSGYEGAALNAGKSVLRSGGTMQEARAAAMAAARTQLAKEGSAVGASTGFDQAAPGQGVIGAVEGGATGGAAGYGLTAAGQAAAPYAKSAVAAITAPKAIDPEVLAAAHGASDLGIDMPKFALSDEGRAKAGALEQTAAGRGPIRAGREAMLDTSETARNDIATGVGTPANTPAQLGDETLDAAVAANKGSRQAIGNLYSSAESLAGGTTIKPTQTLATVDRLIADEQGKIGGSKILPVLQDIKTDLQNGNITIQQARDLRTTLRERLTNDAGSTPSNADRLTNTVMGSVTSDIETGLRAAGKDSALAVYREADSQWAQQRSLEDEVLKPFLGRDFDNWGEQVAAKINSDAKGNGTRLARFLSSLPEDQANNVRASLISGLGKAKDGTQNAAGDRFSLSTFLTNWNQLSGARKLIFSPETVQALDKLANVANVGKLAEAERNSSKTGGVLSRLLMHGGEIGGAGLILGGHIKEGVLAVLTSGLMAARQYGAAKLLANPAFAKKLAATPLNPKAAASFWARPWVGAMAAKNPAIATEVQLFQRAVNDNLKNVLAASPQTGKENQNK